MSQLSPKYLQKQNLIVNGLKFYITFPQCKYPFSPGSSPDQLERVKPGRASDKITDDKMQISLHHEQAIWVRKFKK